MQLLMYLPGKENGGGKVRGRRWLGRGTAVARSRNGSGKVKERQWQGQGTAVARSRDGSGKVKERQEDVVGVCRWGGAGRRGGGLVHQSLLSPIAWAWAFMALTSGKRVVFHSGTPAAHHDPHRHALQLRSPWRTPAAAVS